MALIYVYIFYLRTFCLQVGMYILYLAKIYYIRAFIVVVLQRILLLFVHSHTGPAGNRLCTCYSLLDNAPLYVCTLYYLLLVHNTFFHITYKNSARNYFLLYLTRGEGVLDSERAPAPLSRPIGTQRHERQTH